MKKPPIISHHAYLFANRRANRLKVLVHDGYGIWLANRRLNQGRFCWRHGNTSIELSRPQFDALVLGLSWERLADGGVIRIVGRSTSREVHDSQRLWRPASCRS